jgi:putative ABC transport system permease protein
MLVKFIIRNFRKHPFLNLIKVSGLALGLIGILFIAHFLKNELTYDAFHTKADCIYRFTLTNPRFLKESHFAWVFDSEKIHDLAEESPEIEHMVRIARIRGGVLLYNQTYFPVNQAFECDSAFFEVFDSELLIGDKNTVLNEPGSVVVTESFSLKIFGSVNPVGEVISIPSGQFYDEKIDFTIKGVMKDFPRNSHFHPEMITTPANGEIGQWAYVYLLLHENADPQKIADIYRNHLAESTKQPIEEIQSKVYLQKLTDIHLNSDKLREIEANGSMTNVFVLAFAAIILLLISMSNVASLNLGMAGFSLKFLNVNRMLGSSKQMNFVYFLLESVLVTGIAIVLAITIAIPVNEFIISDFNIDILHGNIVLKTIILLGFVLFSVLSGIQPVIKQGFEKMLPGHNLLKTKSVFVSKGIIITQFTFVIVLIVSVLVISRQTHFALSKSMGAQQNNTICFESVHSNVQKKFELFKAELLKHNTIETVSAMIDPPGGESNNMFPFELEGYSSPANEQTERIGVLPCDYSFPSLFNLHFLSGEDFSDKNIDVEDSGEFILNEAALRYFNFGSANEAIGKRINLKPPSSDIEIPSGTIIGVVKDFHLSSLKTKVKPLVLFKRDQLWLINFVVAYKSGMRDAALADMKSVWDKLFPEYPFAYNEVGNLYRNVYKAELLQVRLLSLFTIISFLICCMGLLGLSLLAAQQRTKEIGIRKVNGARIWEVMAMLNRDFLKWVAIAFVIATPIAWYAMNRWLQNFAYKTELSWWIFALAGLIAMGIALLTVSWQSWRAARRNPVEALRDE